MANNSIQDLFSVKGLVAVITGGGSGLGLYAARALDANGAKAVYILGRREATLRDAAATAKNGTLIPVVCDVGDKNALAAVAEKVRSEQGFINLLFANAGIGGPRTRIPVDALGPNPSVQELQRVLFEPDAREFTETFHVNTSGVYYAAIAFLDLLDAGNEKGNVSQDSQVLVTSSIAGFSRYLSHAFAYSSSKAAANHLVKMLSTFFASQQGLQVRVNLIAPGLYPSEMTGDAMEKMTKFGQEGKEKGSWKDAFVMDPKASPALRTGSEEDFAGTVLFMVSKAGAYLNGETLISDGGRLAQMPAAY